MADPLLQAQQESMLAALEVVDAIVDSTMREVESHELDERALRFATEHSGEGMLSIIEWYWLDCDEGEPDLEENPTWAPDDEPPPVPSDAWSRSALQPRPRPVQLPSASLNLPPALKRGGLGGLGATRQTTRSPQRSVASDRMSQVSDGANLGRIHDLDSYPPPEQPPRRRRQKQEVPVDKWTRAEQQRAKRVAAEQAELENVQQLRKQARGRNYTYDAQGRVIVVNGVDTDQLPSYRLTPHVGVSEVEDAEPPRARSPRSASPPRSSGSGGGGKGGGGGGKGGGSARQRARQGRSKGPRSPAEPEGWRKGESEQPPLAETAKLQPGVTLREGSGVVQLPRSPDQKHLSHKEFEALADAPQRPRRKLSQTEPGARGGGASRRASGAGGGAKPRAQPARAAPPAQQQQQQEPEQPAAYMPPTQPLEGPKVHLTLGQRSRLPRERPPQGNKPLDEMMNDASLLGNDPFGRTPPLGEALPSLLLTPTQGSVLANNSVVSSRSSKRSFVTTRNPGVIKTENAKLASEIVPQPSPSSPAAAF